MQSDEIINEINRLNFEDFIWITFAVISLLNVFGDFNEKEFLKTNNEIFDEKSNLIFKFTLLVALFVYIYFFIRNHKAFIKASTREKELFSIKLLGSSLLIAGILCLIYFQFNEKSFVGSPAL